jgi:hypothetical protein
MYHSSSPDVDEGAMILMLGATADTVRAAQKNTSANKILFFFIFPLLDPNAELFRSAKESYVYKIKKNDVYLTNKK